MLEYVSVSSNISEGDSLGEEINRYFDVTVTAVETLDWWKNNTKVMLYVYIY